MAHGKNWRNWPFDIPGWARTLFDPHAHAITTIDEEHRLVHDGMTFSCTTKVSIGLGATKYFHLKIPVGTVSHWRSCDLSLADGPCDIMIYAEPTLAADGTELTPYNNNFLSAQTPGAQLFVDPTVTDPGTQRRIKFFPDQGGVGANQVGAIASQFGEELVLGPGSYLLAVQNDSGALINAGFEAFWYELSYEDEDV